MSTGRDLLELAAKAAGIDGTYDSWCHMGFNEGIRRKGFEHKAFRPWNPLTDDGDALRLAVKLKMLVNVTDFFSFATSGDAVLHDEEIHNGDPLAATRRAITRAAASIAQGAAQEGKSNG